jgi:hypothetical protein
VLKQKKDEIIEYSGGKRAILDLYGAWEGDENEWDKCLAGIQESWKVWSTGFPPSQ